MSWQPQKQVLGCAQADKVRFRLRLTRLIHNAGREVGVLGLEIELAKCLLVLGEVLSENVPESLGLLRTEIDALVVLDAELIRALGVGLAEDEMKIPDADADLDAVGVGVAVSGGLYHVDARLLQVLAHSVFRLLREAVGKRFGGRLSDNPGCRCGYIGMKPSKGRRDTRRGIFRSEEQC
jgi:hypothetical protein